MFERYTESARRLIFFARFEASRYGSPSIETEHLLRGLLREDRPLVTMFLGQEHIEEEIRAVVERQITQRERISTSVEMPLTTDCNTVLKLAAKEADRLGHRHIETAHVLLGMLGVEGSLAFRLLQAKGLKAAAVREKIAKDFRSTIPAIQGRGDGRPALENFLSGLRSLNSEELVERFSLNTQFTDASGRCWNRSSRCQCAVEERDARQRTTRLGSSDEYYSDSRKRGLAHPPDAHHSGSTSASKRMISAHGVNSFDGANRGTPGGEPFDLSRIREAIESIARLYSTKGYIDATVEPRMDIDDEKRQINLTMRVTEEAQYHVGTVEILGLKNGPRNRLMDRLEPGRVFDASVLQGFLDENERNVSVHRHTQDCTVDIVLDVRERDCGDGASPGRRPLFEYPRILAPPPV
ncbi:MAG: Clp protease N-terminal domain-containing protein [Candidatus Acidiferrum sp.]